MRLFHFTSESGWQGIAKWGYVVSEVPSADVGFDDEAPEDTPSVVWLTDRLNPDGTGICNNGYDGSVEIAIEFELPDADCHHWAEWAAEHGVNEAWQRMQHGLSPEHWWVLEGSPRMDEIVQVYRLERQNDQRRYLAIPLRRPARG